MQKNKSKQRASVMRFLSFVGRVPTQRALRMPMKRLGRRVISERLPMTESISKTAKSLQEGYKEKMRKAKPGSNKLTKLEAQLSVLNALAKHGIIVHANRLAAALAMEHGLERENLLPFLNAAAVLKGKQEGVYNGSIGYLRISIGEDLLTRVHDILIKKAKALSSRDIANLLGYKPTIENRSNITVATGVLDLLGLTKKLPGVVRVFTKGPQERYKWIHSAYALSSGIIPTWNLDWQVLQKLKEKPHKIKELAKEEHFFGKKFGIPDGIGTERSIYSSFLRLKKEGLVKIETIGSGMKAELTDFGRSLLKKQEKSEYLLPKLRELLLGVAKSSEELTLMEMRTLERIMGGARALRELERVFKELKEKGREIESSLRSGYVRAAKQLNEKEGYVKGIANGSYPWRNVTEKNLTNIYLPKMREKDPQLAEWFEKAVAEDLLKKPKTKQA